MDEKVWTKAVNDTTGLKSYYEQNKTNYQWKKRNDAIVLNAADETTLKKALNTLKNSNIYSVSDPSFDTLTFEVGKAGIEKTMQSGLNRIANSLKRDKNLVVKLTAYQDIKDQLNAKRLDSVMAYLGSKKVNAAQLQRDSKLVQDVTYIVTSSVKNKAPKTVQKKPNPLAGKIAFQVYSTSPKALEKTFNADKPLSLEISAGKFQAGENALLDSLEWKTGEFSYKKGNRSVYIISKELIEPTTKTLDEGRGQVISDYQNYLEKEWIKVLRQKYPVTLNEVEFKKLVK
jgi:peptidyl-prolyl cis-trans isomerase SurA